jgi:hypothetical protein
MNDMEKPFCPNGRLGFINLEHTSLNFAHNEFRT